ncbi:MAG TPA: FlgD immunoglobulin-like domain containing protein [Propionicimonas sp.]
MAGLAVLALVAGLSGLTATPAAAVEDVDHVALPRTGYVPEVVAASGTGIILAPATDEGGYRVSVDGGHTFDALAAPAFTGQVSYVGDGKVMYIDPTGDTDAGGDYFDLYTYDFGAGPDAAPVKVYTSAVPLAVSASDAVVIDATASSGFSAVHLSDGQRATLAVPARGATPTFHIDGGTVLAVTTGFIDSVPLSGAGSTSLAVPGLAAAALSESRAYWIQADGSGATLCSAVAATLASPTCRALDPGDHSSTSASLEVGSSWVVARLVTGDTSREYVYLPGPDTLSPVSRTAAMLSLTVYGRGDSDAPLATVLTAAGGYIGSYAAGAVTKLFDLPEATATTSALVVTPQSVSGLDNRPASGIAGSQAWTRPLEGVSLQAENLLSPRATGLSASGDRTLITAADGAHLLDAGDAVRTIAGITDARSLSGPYFLSGSTANADVMRVDGTTVLASAGDVVTLFGSLALRKAGAGYEVVDVTQPSTRTTVDFAQCSGNDFEATGLWGDWVLARESGSGDTVVLDFRHPADCYAHAGTPSAVGDGFALVEPTDPDTGNPNLEVWNFLNGHVDLLAGNPVMVATDGSHKVSWTTATELRTSTLDDTVTPSAPRVLGVLAAPSVAMGSPWTLDLDASKGLQAAEFGLVITDAAGDVVDDVPVPASANGSVHGLTWDGIMNDHAPAPAGVYGWELKLRGSDNGASLVNADGTSTVAGTVTVTGTLPQVTGATPTLSDPNPDLGSVITALPGAWVPTAATLTYQWYAGSVAIYNATRSTYTPVADDLGKTLTVAVTGRAPGYVPMTRTSAASSPVVKTRVTGSTPKLSTTTTTPTVGKEITVTLGAWSPAGVTYLFTWYRDTTPITGATGSKYTPVPADFGHRLMVAVTGSATERTSVTKTSAPSAPVGWPPVTAGAPTLSTSTPVVGKPVTAQPGVWAPASVTFSYQWYRDATPIGSATSNAVYTPVAADLGHTLKVQVIGSAPEHTSLTKTSAPSALVTAGTFAPTVPVLSNTRPAVDQKVTANTGSWGTGVVNFTYQWYRVSSSGKSRAISGAVRADYVVAVKDVGYKLKVKVTGSGKGTASLYSKVSAKVKKATFATIPVPKVTGTAQVGLVLTAVPGTYSPSAKLKYQWYRGSKAIKKATAVTYTLKTADLHKVMKVRITATRPGYITVVRTATLATAVIAAA